MSFQFNIDKILNSSSNIFYEIIDKVAVNSLSNAGKELNKDYVLNRVLMDSIEYSLLKMKSEESFLSQILYKNFGIGDKNSKRRTEIIFLGIQLKEEMSEIYKQQHRINFHEKNIVSTIENLTRLSTAFGRKLHQLDDEKIKVDCKKYLKELYLKIDEANAYLKEFKLRSIYLESCLFKYNELLETIPRYHELREERKGYMLSN